MIKNKYFKEVLDSGMAESASGEKIKIHSGLSKDEIEAIIQIIKENDLIVNTIEIGCAYGISTLAICEALDDKENAFHTVIDPFQESDWKGVGINNIEKAGYKKIVFVQEYSEIVLPKLLNDNKRYDFALIDGYHTFEHTLLDFFYLERMIRPGGIIAIDDSNWPSIRKAISYILNFDNIKLERIVKEDVDFKENLREKTFLTLIKGIYKLIPFKRKKYFFTERIHNPHSFDIKNSSMVFLRKTHDSVRHWKWFEQF
ncbi:class I SAM-dependent methyltransferase [Echinicola marina]|uniref:class I SAM-dependent methyltransferase n=1 Tax=Echinicola marina TaxID=2859768 RepID=UPI001CF6488C|nr:class I SAM-dependent methyltransferase [Echinicola marina]UCS91985.1 class I SAM-dependent methyltransferase [Echinicola marina]